MSICTRGKVQYVPGALLELTLERFQHVVFDNRTVKGNLDTRIVVPAVPQFVAVIADELLSLIGPRRLVSLIQRIEKQGPWRETEKVRKKFKSKDGKITYKYVKTRKFEDELNVLQKLKKGGLQLSENDLARIEELAVLMAPSLAGKNDEKLELVAKKWIESNRSNRSLPEPLREEYLEAYELSFNPLVPRLSTVS
jgi:hypothetical protein